MENALATTGTKASSAMTAALLQLLLLIALGYVASFVVSAGIGLASRQMNVFLPANEEHRLSASALDQKLAFDAEFCSSALPQFGRHSPCEPRR